jgi:hypothetical protein
VHSDVGGGYPERENGLARITLDWMLDEAVGAQLRVDATRRPRVLGAMGPDPVLHKSLEGAWWLLEYFPKRYTDMKRQPPAKRWMIPRGRPRYIPNNAELHPSVFERMRNAQAAYRPANIPAGRTS